MATSSNEKVSPTEWETLLEGEEDGLLEALRGLSHTDLQKVALAKDEDERSFLHRTVAKGKAACVSLMLEEVGKGAEEACSWSDDGGWTPLHSCVSAGHADVADLILPHSDVRAVNSAGATALHYAASKSRLGLISVLMSQGAKVGARDNGGNTPLHRACMSTSGSNVKAVEEILRNVRAGDLAVEIDRRDKEGWTPLHIASYCGNVAMAELLLARGADRGSKDAEEKSPLDYAKDGEMRSILSQ
mmetsp:Transcript_3592/g.9059  ORF Transcript_3592/g.9059 Transcript_3592/m.9059 type:complete len:245 (+) Transcript_3592:13-747(+)